MDKDILESHRKSRKCMNKNCIRVEEVIETTRFTCWFCGNGLQKIE